MKNETIEVLLFRRSGKYYLTEHWRFPRDNAFIFEMMDSPDARRIDGGPVLIPTQEPWGYPMIFPSSGP